MGQRTDLQYVFEELLGSRNVYYQPPETVKLMYPCIVYKKTPGTYWRANNRLYIYHDAYEVTLITMDPDSDLVRKMCELPMCRYERHFVSDNLYHDNFRVYY